MPQNNLNDIVRRLLAADSFLVTTHLNPDGDAIGSVLALSHLLRALGKARIVCANEDRVPRIYEWLPGADTVVQNVDSARLFDLCVIVDASKLDRLGKIAGQIPSGIPTIVIDHHIEDHPCGELNFVDASYAATGEILVELFDAAGLPISRAAAECLYTALTTDTGGFRYSNTTPRSFRYGARLLETGINITEISMRVFDTMSSAKFQLLARVVARARFLDGGRLAYSEVTVDDMKSLGATGEDLEGLINYTRNVDGVEIAALFRELDAQTTRVSLRAQSRWNAAAILQEFGGGGHAAAAGATLKAPLAEARSSVLKHIQNCLVRP